MKVSGPRMKARMRPSGESAGETAESAKSVSWIKLFCEAVWIEVSREAAGAGDRLARSHATVPAASKMRASAVALRASQLLRRCAAVERAGTAAAGVIA